MLQRAIENIGDDFHVAVRMGGEAAARRDPVLVDHPERPESHVVLIVVISEGKACCF